MIKSGRSSMIHEGLGSGAAVLSLAEPRGIFTRTSVAVTGLNFHPPLPSRLAFRSVNPLPLPLHPCDFLTALILQLADESPDFATFLSIPFLTSCSHARLLRYCGFRGVLHAGDAGVRVLVIDQRDLLFVRGARNN